jgi:serine protease
VDRTFSARRFLAAALSSAAAPLAGGATIVPAVARAADYVPGEVVVGYAPGPVASDAQGFATRLGIRAAFTPVPQVEVLRLPRDVSVARAIAELQHRPGVRYVVANYIAHQAGGWIPDNPGRAHRPGGWEAMQWNFLAAAVVNAPQAWVNLIADHHPGGRGVTVAILDTGVAYRNWHQFRRSPGFKGTRFVDPYDFVAHNRFPLDRNGHGTFVAGTVAGTVAEATNDGVGLAGLAYGARIMPVRVLDASGNGNATAIAQGIRYAVKRGAQVINLSLEFDPGLTAQEIPQLIGAIRLADRRGVVVVAAAGNDNGDQLAYPAAAPAVILVGETTSDRCLADYSNIGPGLDLVAPGGGDDASLAADPECHPNRNLPDIYQMTLLDPANPTRFGLPGGYYGTSMAAARVAAIGALVIAAT